MKRLLFLILTSLISLSIFAETTHVVQKGDTLYSISRKYGKTVQEISDANKIDGTSIKVGQKLVIPGTEKTTQEAKNGPSPTDKTASKTQDLTFSAGTTMYVVQKGDTWYGISRANGLKVEELQKLNNADSSTQLKAGQKIIIPNITSAVAAVKPAEPKKTETKNETKPAETTPTAPMTVTDTHSYSGKKGDSSLVWPVKNPEVNYLKGKVSGVTLSARKDEEVNSIREGTVIFAGSYRGFGNVVFIQSKTGHIYAYTGLGKISVSKGEYITCNSKIGSAGIDSYSQKSQITLMVFQNGNPIDPAKAPRG